MDIIIEISKGSSIKYEIENGNLKIDRFLNVPFVYPFNYGYIPNTLAPDNDPLDVFVLMDEPLYPGTIISVTILGAFEMIDNGESDDKMIAIPSEKLNFPEKYTIMENGKKVFQKKFLDEIKFFLENYKKLENKEVVIKGFFDADKANALVAKYQLD